MKAASGQVLPMHMLGGQEFSMMKAVQCAQMPSSAQRRAVAPHS